MNLLLQKEHLPPVFPTGSSGNMVKCTEYLTQTDQRSPLDISPPPLLPPTPVLPCTQVLPIVNFLENETFSPKTVTA